VSSVASGLPDTGDEWDLSGLLVDGQPVSRATAVAWLNAAYQAVREQDFEQQNDSPVCSVDGLYRLLSFADAVGSTKPLLRACCSQLQSMKLHAQLGQQQVALATDGTSYYINSVSHMLLRQPDFSKVGVPIEEAPAAASAEEQQAFKQQVAAQTEQLLWLAHKLQLQPLLQHLGRFVHALSQFYTSLLCDVLNDVFTRRVVEAAGVAGLPGGKQMLMNELLGEVFRLTDSSITGLAEEQRQPLRFEAALPSTLSGFPRGAKVAVELDLFGKSTMTLGASTFQVQLRIGTLYAAP
jgi:hypothetical protein